MDEMIPHAIGVKIDIPGADGSVYPLYFVIGGKATNLKFFKQHVTRILAGNYWQCNIEFYENIEEWKRNKQL